jgi:hypothetical protein
MRLRATLRDDETTGAATYLPPQDHEMSGNSGCARPAPPGVELKVVTRRSSIASADRRRDLHQVESEHARLLELQDATSKT